MTAEHATDSFGQNADEFAPRHAFELGGKQSGVEVAVFGRDQPGGAEEATFLDLERQEEKQLLAKSAAHDPQLALMRALPGRAPVEALMQGVQLVCVERTPVRLDLRQIAMNGEGNPFGWASFDGRARSAVAWRLPARRGKGEIGIGHVSDRSACVVFLLERKSCQNALIPAWLRRPSSYAVSKA
ncbi:hypothetical protein ABIA22_002238 [Sinorhizobium fredii]